MRPPRLALPGLLALLVVASVGAVPSRAQAATEVVPGELLVGVRPGSDVAAEPGRLAAAGVALGHHPGLHVFRLRIKNGLTPAQALARLRQQPEVLYIEPNGIYHTQSTPNDTYYGNQWAPAKMQADQAWSIWQPHGQVIVAVVDTGIDYTHPDLTNKIYRDSSGAVVGYNAVGTNAHSGNATDVADDYGHGTHVAGIIGAQVDNSAGVAGIAGWSGGAGTSDTSTKLMAVKVMDNTGSGTDATVADGIMWATDHGARIINMSLGGGGSQTLQNAVNYALGKGVVVVAAAGNDGTSNQGYPGAYPGVISVAATDNTDTLASWSTWGSWVSVAAPGVNVLSTVPTYSTSGGMGTNYAYASGTSMATPHVSGEAALILAQNPSLNGSQVTTIIKSNVDAYHPYSTHTLGTSVGRVNALRAVQAAGGSQVSVPSAPTGLTATAGNGQVALSWTASSGATSYNVKRSMTNGGPYTTIGSPTATSYTSTGLTNGTTYHYVVSAVNSAGESPNSAQASATPYSSVSVPNPPASLNAAGGNGIVSLSWAASSGATSYSVGRSTTHGGPYNLLASGLSGTSYSDTTVTNGTTYHYVVTASNSAGTSGYSPEASATPQAPTTSGQLLGNPGFENGANASPWMATAGVIDNSTYMPAHSGAWKAWLCGYGRTHTDALMQQVTIPSNVSTATLSFWLRVVTTEPYGASDYLRVQIRNSAGAVLSTLATYSNLNATSGYVQKSFNLSAYRGQTIQVYLLGTENNYYPTSFVVDDFALNVQ